MSNPKFENTEMLRIRKLNGERVYAGEAEALLLLALVRMADKTAFQDQCIRLGIEVSVRDSDIG